MKRSTSKEHPPLLIFQDKWIYLPIPTSLRRVAKRLSRAAASLNMYVCMYDYVFVCVCVCLRACVCLKGLPHNYKVEFKSCGP